jgi:hypothetical protein
MIEERPELLDAEGSNAILMEAWDRAHPNQTPNERKRAQQNLANLKSLLRRKRKQRRGGRPKAVVVLETNNQPKVANVSRPHLELLEENIDDCLILAKRLEPTSLASVIKKLRSARNEVVWMIGM